MTLLEVDFKDKASFQELAIRISSQVHFPDMELKGKSVTTFRGVASQLHDLELLSLVYRIDFIYHTGFPDSWGLLRNVCDPSATEVIYDPN